MCFQDSSKIADSGGVIFVNVWTFFGWIFLGTDVHFGGPWAVIAGGAVISAKITIVVQTATMVM